MKIYFERHQQLFDIHKNKFIQKLFQSSRKSHLREKNFELHYIVVRTQLVTSLTELKEAFMIGLFILE